MRLDDLYTSVQGEGPRVGEPTIFVRFGGCNLKCPGWPCDTQHAIDVKYRDEWERITPYDLYVRILKLQEEHPKNVCLTGGEPFLQQNKELRELVVLLGNGHHAIEAFSNGTLLYPDWALEHINFIMDWKLPGSGEDPFNANRIENAKRLGEEDAIKFVIKDRDDYELAKQIWHENLFYSQAQIFYGVVWNEITNAQVVRWVLEDDLPWRHNMQVHNYIFDRRQRSI